MGCAASTAVISEPLDVREQHILQQGEVERLRAESNAYKEQVTELNRQLRTTQDELAQAKAQLEKSQQSASSTSPSHPQTTHVSDRIAARRSSGEGSACINGAHSVAQMQEPAAMRHQEQGQPEVLPPACLSSPTAAYTPAVSDANDAARSAEEFARQLQAAAGAGYLPLHAGRARGGALAAAAPQQPSLPAAAAAAAAAAEVSGYSGIADTAKLLPPISMFPRTQRGGAAAARAAHNDASPSRQGSGLNARPPSLPGPSGLGLPAAVPPTSNGSYASGDLGGALGATGCSVAGPLQAQGQACSQQHPSAAAASCTAPDEDSSPDAMAMTLTPGGGFGAHVLPLLPPMGKGQSAWGNDTALNITGGSASGGAASGGELNSTHRYGRAMPSDFKLAQQLRGPGMGPRQGFV